MKKSITLNYIYNTLYQVLTLVTPLITAPYLARVLRAEGIGRYSYESSIVSYFVLLAALGIGMFGQREIASHQDSRKIRSQVFWDLKALSVLTTGIALVAYFVMCFFLDDPELYIVLSLSILSCAVDIAWLYQGMEDFGAVVLRNTIIKILDVAFVFLFIKEPEDLLLYVFGVTGMSLLSVISMWWGVGKYIDRPIWKNIKPFRNFSAVLSLFIPTLAIQVYTVLDKTMIGLITQSDTENGYYEQAIKLSKMVLMLVTSLGTVMIPRMSYYFEQRDTEKVQDYMKKAFSFVWFLGIPLCFGLIGTASSLVPWFYGDGYEKVVPLLQILSLLIPIIGINNITGWQYLVASKRQNLFTKTVVIGAVTNFVLNLALITFFQSIGAAIASVIAEIVVTEVQFWILRNELPIWDLLKLAWKYLAAGALMLVGVLLLNALLPNTIPATILLVATGIIIYFVGLLIMKDEFLLCNAASMLKKIMRRN